MLAEKSLSSEESKIIEQYYKENYGLLLKYAYHVLHDQSCAEVAVQETFVVASRRVEKLMASERPVGWLFNTLKYIIKDMERDRAAVLQHCVSLNAAASRAEETYEPEELDENDRDLALLRRFYVDGYKLSELAAELQTTVPALKMRIYRAKKRLREDPRIKDLKDF